MIFLKKAIVACALIVAILLPFTVANDALLSIFAMALLYSSMAMAWNIYGLTGTISLGHASFFGLGAYGYAMAIHFLKVPAIPGLLIGSIFPVCYAMIWNICFQKLKKHTFALATFASVEIPRAMIENIDIISSKITRIIDVPMFYKTQRLYFWVFIFALLVFIIHRGAIVSVWGWAIRAIREDEITASSIGIPVKILKWSTLLISAFLTGICGGLYLTITRFIEPSLVFNIHFSAIPLILSFFGGRFHVFGPLVGTTILYGLDQLLIVPFFPVAHTAIYGIVILVTLWLLPGGLLSWFEKNKKNT